MTPAPHQPGSAFEANVAAHAHRSGERLLGVGDASTRVALGMRSRERAADLLSYKARRYHLREVKESYGTGGVDVEHALTQMESTITALRRVDRRARIGTLEIAVPESASFTGNYRVRQGILEWGENDVWSAVRLSGRIVTVRRYADLP